MSKLFIQLFILSLGVMVFAAGASKIYTYGNYRVWGESTYGVVERPASGRGLGGRPLVRYEDNSGLVHEFKSVAKTHWLFRPVTGDKIKIYFSKDEPQNAIIDSLFFYLFLPILFISVGGFCCIYAIFFHQKKSGE
ncbi:MAG: DUF3592 domain-containing protein [Desulfofustis sp.]|nr:DUF3592 domain-containing protein [Desulfofustis sp.]